MTAQTNAIKRQTTQLSPPPTACKEESGAPKTALVDLTEDDLTRVAGAKGASAKTGYVGSDG